MGAQLLDSESGLLFKGIRGAGCVAGELVHGSLDVFKKGLHEVIHDDTREIHPVEGVVHVAAALGTIVFEQLRIR